MFKDKLMVGKENKKLILGVLLTFIVCIGSAIFAAYMTNPQDSNLKYPNPGHYPGEIGPGTFNCSGTGSNCYFKFTDDFGNTGLKINNGTTEIYKGLHVATGYPLVVDSNTYLGEDSSDKTTVKGDLNVSGNICLDYCRSTWPSEGISCADCDTRFVNEGQLNSITSGMVDFNYAGSSSEGGAANNAKSCNADGTCEADNLNVSGNTQLGDSSSDKVKAYQYCDEIGANCHDASTGWATGGGGCCSLLDTLNTNSDASGFTGTTTLGGDLDITEGVKVGNSSITCNSSTEGTVKYNYAEHRLEVCDGSYWVLASGEVPCSCPGTGYKTYNVSGDTVYVDCNADKCWTPTAGSTYIWGGYGTDEPTNSCVGIANRPACNYCDNLDYGGFTDWVLPDKTILQNLCNSGSCSGSCFNGDDSTSTYWSSTDYSSRYNAYKVLFNLNYCSPYHCRKDEPGYVRCVRG